MMARFMGEAGKSQPSGSHARRVVRIEGRMRMPENQGVATTRRRLRTELRRLRDLARLHQADVVKKLDWSISKLIRIENGSVGISITDLKALTEIYGADQATIDELV